MQGREQADARGPGVEQRLGTGGSSGSGGEHVINQQNALSGHLRAVCHKCAGQGGEALLPAPGDLLRAVTRARQRFLPQDQPRMAADRAGQRGLVVSALAQA